MNIIDLFVLMPLRKNHIPNGSKNMYQVMSMNKQEKFSPKHHDEGTELNKMLELFWSKLEERFVSVKDSFRFIDKNKNCRVSFNEFVAALDDLKLNFSIESLS